MVPHATPRIIARPPRPGSRRGRPGWRFDRGKAGRGGRPRRVSGPSGRSGGRPGTCPPPRPPSRIRGGRRGHRPPGSARRRARRGGFAPVVGMASIPGSAGRTSPARSRSSLERLPSTRGVCQPPRTARYVRAPTAEGPRTRRSPSPRGALCGIASGRSRPSRRTIAARIGAPARAIARGIWAWKVPPTSVSSSTARSAGLPSRALARAEEPRSKAPATGTPHSR